VLAYGSPSGVRKSSRRPRLLQLGFEAADAQRRRAASREGALEQLGVETVGLGAPVLRATRLRLMRDNVASMPRQPENRPAGFKSRR